MLLRRRASCCRSPRGAVVPRACFLVRRAVVPRGHVVRLLSAAPPVGPPLRNTATPDLDDTARAAARNVFESVWHSLEEQHGQDSLIFPKEIMWLGGAPGSGKGTNTAFIQRERSLTSQPIVMSDLLQSPEAQAIKAAGGLVGDREVASILLHELLDEKYRASGVVVDGFPRSSGQAHMLKLLHDKLFELHRAEGRRGLHPRPIFRICVLFVDRDVSVSRQLARGEHAKRHNDKVRERGGEGSEMQPERPTDFDPALAEKRFEAFETETFSALESLGQHFIYNFIVRFVLAFLLRAC